MSFDCRDDVEPAADPMNEEWAAVHAYQMARWKAEAVHPLDIYNKYIGQLADDMHVRLLIGKEFCRGSRVLYDASRFGDCPAAMVIHTRSCQRSQPFSNLGNRFEDHIKYDPLTKNDSELHVIRAENNELAVRGREWKAECATRIIAAAGSCWLTPAAAAKLNKDAVYLLRKSTVHLFGHILDGEIDRNPEVRRVRAARADGRRAELVAEHSLITKEITHDPADIVMSYAHEPCIPPLID